MEPRSTPLFRTEETEFLRARLQGAEAFIARLLAERSELTREIAEMTRDLARMNEEVIHVYREYAERRSHLSAPLRGPVCLGRAPRGVDLAGDSRCAATPVWSRCSPYKCAPAA